MHAIVLAAMVIIQAPTVRLLPLQTIHALCGTAGEYDACTRFVAYRLEASCSGRHAVAAATFRPLIFLYNIHELSHEYEHIEDIRAFAERFVTNVEQRTFDSETECRDEMRLATTEFAERLAAAATDSVRRLH